MSEIVMPRLSDSMEDAMPRARSTPVAKRLAEAKATIPHFQVQTEVAMDEALALAARVRAGEVSPTELSGATFTVSNLGMFGMTAITPVISPPQAAILGVGALRETLRPRRQRDRRPNGDDTDLELRPPDPLRRRRSSLPRRDQSAARSSTDDRVVAERQLGAGLPRHEHCPCRGGQQTQCFFRMTEGTLR